MREWRPLAGCVMLAGCGGGAAADVPVRTATDAAIDWRRIATPADRRRLRDWRVAWVGALGQARADAGFRTAQANDPTLFNPDRTMAGSMPPAGEYRCRTLKLGTGGDTRLAYVAYGWFRCRIGGADGMDGFVKIDGSQRPVGRLHADTDARTVFLGTLMLGDEMRAMRYGRDGSRDMAGIVERIGERRWRMVLPYPRFESTLDVIELVPA